MNSVDARTVPTVNPENRPHEPPSLCHGVPLRVLFATDGSDNAWAAADLLAALPLPSGTLIHVLTVLPRNASSEAIPPILDLTSDALHRGAVGMDTDPARRKSHLKRLTRYGHPAEEILRASDEFATDLILLGASGHSALGRLLLGDTAEQVARYAHCSVLVTRGRKRTPEDPAGSEDSVSAAVPTTGWRVLVGVQQTETAEAALRSWAYTMPLPKDSTVTLVSAVAPDRVVESIAAVCDHPDAARLLAGRGHVAVQEHLEWFAAQVFPTTVTGEGNSALPVRPAIRVIPGTLAEALLQVAAEEGADMIVLPAGDGHSSTLAQNPTELLHHAPCSVLLARVAKQA